MGTTLSSSKTNNHLYETREQLADALALSVSGLLAGGIAARGQAVLAVSGGSTPKLFFNVLSQADLDWSQVSILLVDERIVPETSERANTKLVRENLLINKASKAKLLTYAVDGETPAACAKRSEALLGSTVADIDALILGVGLDGHTASFFPGGDNLAAALDRQTERKVLSMTADGAGEPRLTLTLPVILAARFLAIHIEGSEKKAMFEQAAAGNDADVMPVRAVLDNAPSAPDLFWAP